MTSPKYRGRFAPSPTGPLHFGSLVAALGSWLDARAHGGEWLVRIEDIDPPREVAGASDAILRSLEAHHLYWDGNVLYQHTRSEAYRAALDALHRNGVIYPCTCTRKQIADRQQAQGLSPNVYPGTCRPRTNIPHEPHALRVNTTGAHQSFMDRIQGLQQQNIESEVGDFVVRRADGLFAYQLAVVVDDGEQGITDIVRGSDLLDNTPRQLLLQQLLKLPTPRYAHLPVAVNAAGQKLSKQTFAPPLDDRHPLPALREALRFLGLPPPHEFHDATIDELLTWAVNYWNIELVPKQIAVQHT
ncbi:MAG TPA: tRNA glutamyl-Q(34) synthetase GluQRS [Gammaproteobacteria bacterium]